MKKNLTLLALLACSIMASAQSLYDINQIQQIEIYFSQTNWDFQMDTAKAGAEGYIISDSVRINGVNFVDVGVKYKGNSSYNANGNKNPLHINLDYVHGDQHYEHYTDLKLGNGFSDPSNIREVLSYDILRKYMDAPLSNFAQVYINGALRGLYSNDESINKHFLGGHYYSAEDAFFKCNPLGGAGPGSQGSSPNLAWISSDSSSYFSSYEMQSDAGWNLIVDLIDTLNNTSAAIDQILDIDRCLWMLAYNNVLVNLDSYTGNFKQNYYLYRDLNHRWVPTVWDLNMSFGGFPGNNLSVSGMQNLTPLFSLDAQHPLIQKLLNNPVYQRMYIAHMRTILQENFSNGEYITRANELMAVINSAVQSDPYPFYTYTQFQNSLTTNTTGGGGGPGGGTSIPGIQVLMDARSTYLESNTLFTAVDPSITQVQPNIATPVVGSLIYITAQISNATAIEIGYRFDHTRRFFRFPMFDDGQHQDGSAGDGLYGAAISMNDAQLEYYIFAENASAAAFSPERAEHEFYHLVASANQPSVGDVVINEVLASNSVQEDEYGQSDDWVELYNNSSNTIDLSNCFLSDSTGYLEKWLFPAGTLMAPHSYLIVWTDDDEEQVFHHSNFNLSAIGEPLYLSMGGQVLDQMMLPIQSSDISYGRYPNATGNWTYMFTTFAAPNSISTGADHEDVESWSVYPNPCGDQLSIQSPDAAARSFEIVSMDGKILSTGLIGLNGWQMDMSSLPSGNYFIIVKTMEERISIPFVRL